MPVVTSQPMTQKNFHDKKSGFCQLLFKLLQWRGMIFFAQFFLACYMGLKSL